MCLLSFSWKPVQHATTTTDNTSQPLLSSTRWRNRVQRTCTATCVVSVEQRMGRTCFNRTIFVRSCACTESSRVWGACLSYGSCCWFLAGLSAGDRMATKAFSCKPVYGRWLISASNYQLMLSLEIHFFRTSQTWLRRCLLKRATIPQILSCKQTFVLFSLAFVQLSLISSFLTVIELLSLSFTLRYFICLV